MITVGGALANRSRRVSPPEDRDELLVDDLDDLLGGVQRLGDLGAGRPLLDLRDELADHRQRDVRFQQRDPDLAGGGVDVRGGQPPCPRSEEKTWVSRSERVSNTCCCRPRAWPVAGLVRAGCRAPRTGMRRGPGAGPVCRGPGSRLSGQRLRLRAADGTAARSMRPAGPARRARALPASHTSVLEVGVQVRAVGVAEPAQVGQLGLGLPAARERRGFSGVASAASAARLAAPCACSSICTACDLAPARISSRRRRASSASCLLYCWAWATQRSAVCWAVDRMRRRMRRARPPGSRAWPRRRPARAPAGAAAAPRRSAWCARSAAAQAPARPGRRTPGRAPRRSPRRPGRDEGNPPRGPRPGSAGCGSRLRAFPEITSMARSIAMGRDPLWFATCSIQTLSPGSSMRQLACCMLYRVTGDTAVSSRKSDQTSENFWVLRGPTTGRARQSDPPHQGKPESQNATVTPLKAVTDGVSRGAGRRDTAGSRRRS